MNEKISIFDARVQVGELLPDAIISAVESYRDLLKSPACTADAKADHHKALKICAAHIEQLLKIAAQTHEDKPAHDLPGLIASARAEIESRRRNRP